MNREHLELCASAEWAETIEHEILPWVLDGISLGDDVIELGPGPGRTTDILRRQVPQLTAVEVDPVLAAALTDRLADTNVEVVHGDATRLAFADNRFSAALALTMLHHVPTEAAQDRLLSEVARVLRPDGVFAGVDSLDSEAFRQLHLDDICVPLDPVELPARLRDAGFADVEVDTTDRRVRFRARGTAAPSDG